VSEDGQLLAGLGEDAAFKLCDVPVCPFLDNGDHDFSLLMVMCSR
jgi:hypothetical protein